MTSFLHSHSLFHNQRSIWSWCKVKRKFFAWHDRNASVECSTIIYARDLKDSLIKEHFFHCIHTHVYLYDEFYDFKKSEELKVSIFILIRSNIKRNVMIKIWRLKRKKVIRTSWGSRHKGETKRKKKKRWTQHGNGERKISTAFQFIFRF